MLDANGASGGSICASVHKKELACWLELQACDWHQPLVVVVDHNVPLNGTVEPGKASKQVGKGRKRPVVPARPPLLNALARALPDRADERLTHYLSYHFTNHAERRRAGSTAGRLYGPVVRHPALCAVFHRQRRRRVGASDVQGWH